ncbi:putative protein EARLY FLOWERING 4 [Helianthus anomalus]
MSTTRSTRTPPLPSLRLHQHQILLLQQLQLLPAPSLLQALPPVNENHRSKNHESMVSNVALIQDINNNVSNIVAMYANLSVNFSSVFN